MSRKSISCRQPWIRSSFSDICALGVTAWCAVATAADNSVIETQPKLLGAASCSSSGCHGGGGATQNQFQVWSLRDFHSQRPFATLTTARSKQIADALGIKTPTENSRCTACHAPLQTVATGRRPGVKISEGVLCESCHGPAENWLRGHTRTDWSHADRATAGMRDLKDLYERANTCVACHQTVESALLKAGHPELLFELDGQTVSEPRHWRESTNFNGGQAWLVGQAVALRELSWQQSRESDENPKIKARWQAASWLIQKVAPIVSSALLNASDDASAMVKPSDRLALAASEMRWTTEMSQKCLFTLAATGPDFLQRDVASEIQARRAERLVFALDRLKNDVQKNQTDKRGESELNILFKLAQSIPDFDSQSFAGALDKFALTIRN